MKRWQRAVFWAALPLLLPVLAFVGLAAINWNFESKLFEPMKGATDWVSIHLGLVLLSTAAGMALLASVILFLIRILGPDSGTEWFMFIPLTLVTLLLVFPSTFILMLGPSGLTMMQSMRPAP